MMLQPIAGALVFSGRPDPAWPVDEAQARSILDLWDSLEPATIEAPSPPPLGYRGAFLRDTEGNEWRAYGGVVTLIAPATEEHRSDPDRAFEQKLLASAPTGTLPGFILDSF